jgi:hypothetical protein
MSLTPHIAYTGLIFCIATINHWQTTLLSTGHSRKPWLDELTQRQSQYCRCSQGLGDADVHSLGCSYLLDCPKSRDQPSQGPAVALVPPLLNSGSDMSSGLNVVDWLLLSLKNTQHRWLWIRPKQALDFTVNQNMLFCFFFSVVLGFEVRASCLLDSALWLEPHCQP